MNASQRTTLAVLALVVSGAASTPARAQAPDSARAATGFHHRVMGRLDKIFAWWNEDRRFSLYDENDAFGGTSDSAYTQGLRMQWDLGAWPEAPWYQKIVRYGTLSPFIPGAADEVNDKCSAVQSRRARPCGMTSFAITQTMYTPPNLLETALDPKSRPYAGYLFASTGATLLYERTIAMTELSVGVIGPWSGSKETQSLAHWTWSSSSPEPLGWSNQLHNRWQASLRSAWATQLLEWCRHECSGQLDEGRVFDVVPTAEVVFGTVMKRVTVGGTAHLGYRFADLSTPGRIPTTRSGTDTLTPPRPPHLLWNLKGVYRQLRDRSWGMIFAGVDARAVFANSLITGTGADDCATCWKSLREISLNRDVHEFTRGFVLGVGNLSVGYQRVTRSSEYRPGGGSHTFGAMTVSYVSLKRQPGG